MVATKRRFDPNLQRVRILVNGAAKRVYVCTRCLKSGKVSEGSLRRRTPAGRMSSRPRLTFTDSGSASCH